MIIPRYEDIRPDKVTKPFQLLGAWVVGMIVLVGEFIFVSEKTHKIYLWDESELNDNYK
ncbi:MAG: hypothetical protein KKB25_00265 [Nanoarchaeota archaeon]|nr:hypothetical protein [Nanoarchaeota archaeon]